MSGHMRHHLVIRGYGKTGEGSYLAPGINKIAMSRESSRRIVLLHADSSECVRKNQLALIEG